jgi:hypothetical protein
LYQERDLLAKNIKIKKKKQKEKTKKRRKRRRKSIGLSNPYK